MIAFSRSDSLKFLSEKTISAIGTEEFQKSKINEISSIISNLFNRLQTPPIKYSNVLNFNRSFDVDTQKY